MNIRTRSTLLLTLATCLLSACGGNDVDGEAGQAAEPAQKDSQATESVASTVTGEYLEGPWCYAHWESMGETETPNEDYVFRKDGSLLYAHASGGAVDNEGTWEVDGQQLKIHPKFTYFNLVIKSVEPDLMILDNIGFHHFQRGGCIH